jgi:hypothetical protein
VTGLVIPGLTAPGDAPPGPDIAPGQFAVTDLPDLPPEFLVELGTAPPTVAVEIGSIGMPGGEAVGGLPDMPPATPGPAVLRYSLRGWIGEPEDAMAPNLAYPSRLMEPPSLVRSMRVLPEDSARASFQSGEISLRNDDGALNEVAGDWTMAGRPAVIRRGPHRQPRRAGYQEFGRVADLRITSAALSDANRIRIGLREAASDLQVPVSTPYAGTGGLEGDANLSGQLRPMLYGVKRQIPPVALLANQEIRQVSGRPLSAVFGVRDRGSELTPFGDYPSLSALSSAPLFAGGYATCLTEGLIRTASTPQGQLTVDAVGAGDTSHGGIALALLRGPGGQLEERLVPAGFTAQPAGAAGFLWSSGTVASALDEVMAACAGWWGSDRLGRIVAGRLRQPDSVGPEVTFARWMLQAEPAEQGGVAPRWRQRVAYRRLETVQSATDLAGIASEDPALVAAYGTAQQVAIAFDTAITLAFPSATDAEPLPSGFDDQADAQALAAELLALHGVRRRRWRLSLGRWGHLVDLGAVVAVDHPRLAGRNWIVIASEEAGDDKTLTVWG